MKKIVVVCKHAYVRSSALRDYLKKLLRQNNIDNVEVNNAGIDPFDWNREKLLTKEMIEESDVIFAMDQEIYDYIMKNFTPPFKKITNLDVLDVYDETGRFSEYGLTRLCIDLAGKDMKEKKEEEWGIAEFRENVERIKNSLKLRPELMRKLSLEETLEMKESLILKKVRELLI